MITIACDDNNKLISEIKTSNMTELATFLGVSYRHLNRVIKNLCVRGLIKRTREGLKILDYEKLKEMSGGYYE
ncbi:helix-turn-helix domain-containing protein [Alkaliphilus crotonatoxidans]